MKTTIYNPSPIETELANALVGVRKEIESQLKNLSIHHASANVSQDNPSVMFNIVDQDGDHHEVIVKVVQIPDKL